MVNATRTLLSPHGLTRSSGGGIDSRRVLDVLVNNLEGMVFRCAIDEEWTFHLVSDGCFELCGYSPTELLSHGVVSWELLTHTDDRARVRQRIMAAVERGERYRVQYRILCRDGKEKWVLERGTCVRDERGERVLEGFIEDVSEQVASQALLADAELRYRSIFEDSVVGMFQTSVDGRYLAANRALANLYGYGTPDELRASMADIANHLYVDPARRAEFIRCMEAFGRVSDFQSEVYRRDGGRIWISENAHSVRGPDGQVLYYEGTVEDVTESRQYRTLLEYQATHDPLTGLPNRNLLQDRLDQALSLANRHHGQGALAFVDIDNFKFINDSLGHDAGDHVLVEMAKRLKSCLRGADTVARYGGDEFVLILSEQSLLGDTLQALERVQSVVGAPLTIDGHELRLDCSIGVTLFPEDGRDLLTLLRHADAAMHHAKRLGKGQFQFFTAAMNQAVQERLALEHQLRRGLENGELSVAYQPKVDVRHRLCGFEALVRWESEDGSRVSPVKFIPLAEETGLILPLTDFVLRAACREAASWPARGLGAHKVAVNLSPRLFREQGLVDKIATVLAETGLPADCLELEITESMLMGDVQRAQGILESLKAMGVTIAIDDFGTGYSSLAYLKRFPIDTLKVDRSFVMECDQSQEASTITRAIVSLARSLGLRVVAEGVEKPSQMAVLAALGCEEYQGFLIARPLATSALEAFFASHPA